MTNPRFLLICNTSDGLTAQINGVIIQLQMARRLGLEPIVYLHERSYMFGGPNPYFDADQGPNVWDYYFDPIGPSGADLTAAVQAGDVVTLTTGSELVRLFRWDPDSWFMNPFGYYRSVANMADGPYPAAWWAAQRDKARPFLDDGTVAFNQSIAGRIEAFAAQSFPDHVLGIQMRGSDKFDFGVGPNLSEQIAPQAYYPLIDAYLAQHPDCKGIFIATDQRQWLKDVQADYPEFAISYSEKSLSDGKDNMFHATEQKAARGAEVLVDMGLLAKCRHVIKCHAAVGEMALTMNPAMTFVDMNYEHQPFTAMPTAMRRLSVPAIRAVSAHWKRRAEAGGALVPVVSVDGHEVMVDPANPRSLNIKTEAGEKAPRPPLFSDRFISDGLDWSLRKLSATCYRYR